MVYTVKNAFGGLMEQDNLIIALLILLVGFISIEIGISTAILEILAGVIGANLFGLSISEYHWLNFIADFGLLGLMFFAGFETDPNILKKRLFENITLGTVSYLAPFIIIFLIAITIFGFSINTAIVISIALSTTSLALVYSVSRDLGKLSSLTGQILLGSAMVADILSMLSLTLLIGGYGIYTVLYAVALLVLLYLSPKIGKVIFTRYKGNPTEIEIKFILLLLLIMPFFSERVGISEAVFAFLLGVLFSEMIEEDKVVEEKLRGLIFGFFAPAFFFKAGSLINVSYITTYVIILILIFGLLAYLSKYLSTYLLSRKLLKGEVNPKTFGLFFNFRLTFGVVAALFGLENGYLAEELYIVILIIILSTSVISAVLLKAIPKED